MRFDYPAVIINSVFMQAFSQILRSDFDDIKTVDALIFSPFVVLISSNSARKIGQKVYFKVMKNRNNNDRCVD